MFSELQMFRDFPPNNYLRLLRRSDVKVPNSAQSHPVLHLGKCIIE